MDGLNEPRMTFLKQMAAGRGQDRHRAIPPNFHTLPALQDPVTTAEDCPRFEFPRKHELHATDALCRFCGYWMKET